MRFLFLILIVFLIILKDLPAALPGGAAKRTSRQSIAARSNPPPAPTSRTLPTRSMFFIINN